MNVTFRLATEELEKAFVKESTAAGLDGLKGHRSVGGMRASIYNAFPEEGVDALVSIHAGVRTETRVNNSQVPTSNSQQLPRMSSLGVGSWELGGLCLAGQCSPATGVSVGDTAGGGAVSSATSMAVASTPRWSAVRSTLARTC